MWIHIIYVRRITAKTVAADGNAGRAFSAIKQKEECHMTPITTPRAKGWKKGLSLLLTLVMVCGYVWLFAGLFAPKAEAATANPTHSFKVVIDQGSVDGG